MVHVCMCVQFIEYADCHWGVSWATVWDYWELASWQGGGCRKSKTALDCVHSFSSSYTYLQLKEKERRLRLRAEKMEEQRLYQELKLRRMQERAHAGPANTVIGTHCTCVYISNECVLCPISFRRVVSWSIDQTLQSWGESIRNVKPRKKRKKKSITTSSPNMHTLVTHLHTQH